MRDDDRIRTLVDLVGNGHRELLPVGGIHVLGEDREQDAGIDIGELPDLGDRVHHVRSGERRMDRSRPVVDVRCDRSAGTDEDDLGEPLAELHGGLLPDPLGGLAQNLDPRGIGDADTDVVPALDLEDQHVGGAELVMGHQGSFEGPSVLLDSEPRTLGRTERRQGLGKRIRIAHVTEQQHGRVVYLGYVARARPDGSRWRSTKVI